MSRLVGYGGTLRVGDGPPVPVSDWCAKGRIMTERQWLACTDPERMMRWLCDDHARATGGVDRKLRCFVEACRLISVPDAGTWAFDLDSPHHLHQAAILWSHQNVPYERKCPAALRADLLRDICGNPFRPIWRTGRGLMHGHVEKGYGFGTHHRVADLAAWLTWQNGTVPKIAQEIYDSRRFEDMPVLADALEDSGCTDEAILRHCRGQKPCWQHPEDDSDGCTYCKDGWVDDWWGRTPFPTPPLHVRGCWCLDLLLVKE